MKLTVLLDNNTLIDHYYKGEPGLSYFIEADGCRFLLDTGYSSVFLENAHAMAIDLRALDGVLLSHGHNDHTRGLYFLCSLYKKYGMTKKPRLIAHPEAFCAKQSEGLEIGMELSADVLREWFALEPRTQPLWLTEHLLWLGEIPRKHAFESRVCGTSHGAPDALPDDTALVYHAPEGLVVITGCSHSGICNIIDHAIALTGETRILDVIGGFHLLDAPEEHLLPVCGFLAAKQPARLHPCHCTDLAAKIKLSKVLPVCEVGVGTTLEF